MQKTSLFLSILVLGGLAATAPITSAQIISLSGSSSGPINAGSGFISSIQLTISGANTIGDIESLNALLDTPASGANSGASYFTITNITPTSPFTTTNAGSGAVPASFTLTGDSANAGTLVSSSSDIGSNAPAGSNAVAATGMTVINVETLTLTSAANTPSGTYNFRFTSGGNADAQGSYVDNMAGSMFDLNSTPTFTVTVVPEPTTWALLGLGAVALASARPWRRRALGVGGLPRPCCQAGV